MHFSSPGDVIAALIMPSASPVYPLSAISMGPSRCIKLQREVYLNHWNNDPQLILRIQTLLTTRMVALQQQKALNKAPLTSKVASLLINLADKQINNEHSHVPIPLTRKEIADSIGSTVESVIRIMSDWSKKGYISTTDQHITIQETSKMIELMSAET
jgi:CRP-like cAMP-binding protein